MTRLVDVIIPIHDYSRPIERAVASVMQDADVRDDVRVIVVCHGIDPDPVRERLQGVAGEVTVLPFTDGIRSAAGPFNAGLDAVTAEYLAVMGSDDFLEPGAMSDWLGHIREHRPAAAMVRIRLQGEAIMPNPLVRLGRSQKVDPVKDRLFYRTAPLGLLRTERVRDLGLRFAQGVRVGEDLAFGVQMWTRAGRVDFLRASPCYVIGRDAETRTTEATLSMEESLEAMERLIGDTALMSSFSAATRRALAIKLLRIHVLGALSARRSATDWRGDDEVAYAAGAIRRLMALDSRILEPFNRTDRRILDGLLAEPTVERVIGDVRRSTGTGRRERWLTQNPLHSLGRETTLRRYVLYYLKRERGAQA